MPAATLPQASRYHNAVSACAEMLRLAKHLDKLAASHPDSDPQIAQTKADILMKAASLPLALGPFTIP